MIVKIHARPELTLPRTRAKTANRIARNVDNIAANWGLFPKGTATKKDQLAKERPHKRWTAMIKGTLVAEKIRYRHIMATMIHAGK